MPRIIECDLYNSRKFTRNHVCDLRNVGRVPHRVRDVPVPQVLLDRSRIRGWTVETRGLLQRQSAQGPRSTGWGNLFRREEVCIAVDGSSLCLTHSSSHQWMVVLEV